MTLSKCATVAKAPFIYSNLLSEASWTPQRIAGVTEECIHAISAIELINNSLYKTIVQKGLRPYLILFSNNLQINLLH